MESWDKDLGTGLAVYEWADGKKYDRERELD